MRPLLHPLQPPATIHLMGISGTAMGAFAGMLQDLGYTITGSDTGIYPPMSDYLAGLNIRVMEGFEAANLNHRPDLVVVGNVVRSSYPEAQALLSSDLPYTSMPELLGQMFLSKAHSTVVAGTHGKTTTTAITAWLLEAAGLHPGFLIGGVALNFDRTARAGNASHFVVEGDEYDTAFFDKRPKFVHYRPDTAIITSIEFDHADIYRDLDHVKESFRLLVESVPVDGVIIARWDDPNVRDVCRFATCRVLHYGPSQPWDGRIDSVDTDKGTMTFTVLRDGKSVGQFTSIMVGEHNLYNQVAATAAAMELGATADALAKGFSTFRGIKRRQEILAEPGGVTILDDFAHHPTAVKVTLAALRQRFGRRRLIAVWEPRSATSRRADFQEAYASSFDDADLVVVSTPFDQSRIDVGNRFSSDRLVEDLASRGVDAVTLSAVDDIVTLLAARAMPRDVIAVLSNGGFGGLHKKLITALDERFAAAAPRPG